MSSEAANIQQLDKDRAPEQLGKYIIVKKVGSGTTGDVYLGHDPYYGRDVAIKKYFSDAINSEDAAVFRKMFFNEAHMVGMLQHPNILPIYDAGEENGNYYIVMEHVHGARTLTRYSKPDSLLPIDDVVEIIFKCAKALHYAHSRGVVHRDIKPSNVMLTQDNDVRIIDFGIAVVADSEVSHIDGIAGSPSYMSPEQVQSQTLTNKSDIFSLGSVMYEMLTGTRPFRAPNLSKLLHQIIYATPPPIHAVRKDGTVPEILEDIVVRMLQKDPAKRFANGLDLAAELTRAYQELSQQDDQISRQEQFNQLRRLRFFHDFSYPEIWEVLRASEWRTHAANEEIVREGEIDDRFYIIVAGRVSVERNGRVLGTLEEGDGFGETSYVDAARRTATIKADSNVTLIRVSATLLEQASMACQLHFNKVFLKSLIERLQRVEKRTS